MSVNRLFDFYSRCLWPIHRLIAGGLSRRCKKCILSEAYCELQGDICEHCRNYKSPKKENKKIDPKTLDLHLRSYISDNTYDIALMLSGGKDSAYILHRLRTEYPNLKVLNILVNNGFLSPVAVDNAKKTAAKCDADLLVVNSFVEEFRDAFRKSFLDLDGRPCYGVVDFTDGDMVFRYGRQVAKSMGIPALIGGLSWVQAEVILGLDSFEQIHDDNFRSLFPLWVWRTDEQDIRKYVLDHDLIPSGNDSPLVSNSQLILVMCVLDILNLGYCSFEPEFAQLVREGKTDRKVWLHLFELLEYGAKKGWLNKGVNNTLSKLNLSLNDIVGE